MWYEDDEFWTTFHDCMFLGDRFRAAEQEIADLVGWLDVDRRSVLDLACGPGRHLPFLTSQFDTVCGVDLSPYLLGKAEQFSQQLDLAVELVQEDMRTFSRAQSFDLIVCLWSSFGYFDSMEGDYETLSRCRENLRPDGALVLDVVGKEYLVRNLEAAHVREFEDGTLLLERPCLEDDMSRMSNEWTLIQGDKATRRTWSQNVYSGVELRGLLHQAGFAQVDLFGGYAGEDYDLDSERLIAVARGPLAD